MTTAARPVTTTSSPKPLVTSPSPIRAHFNVVICLRVKADAGDGVTLRLPHHRPLLRLLHYSCPSDGSPSQRPPPSQASELWIAKALAAATLLRPHHLPAFRPLSPSPVAAAVALGLAPCASSALSIFTALHYSPLFIPPSAHSYKHVIVLLCKSGR
ncbi:hypothetical protein ABZP36_004092 [Zizania latifolia]